MTTEDEGEDTGPTGPIERRILKVRLPQDQVIRLHELRILRGKSIAALLENILEDYLRRDAPISGHAHSQAPPREAPPVGPT